jgi:hypothetical protein
LVWNSVRSTLRAPSKRREAVREETTGRQAVQVGVGGALNVEVAAAEIVQGLVVEQKATVGVLKQEWHRQDGVVGLNDGGGDLGRGPDGEPSLDFLP